MFVTVSQKLKALGGITDEEWAKIEKKCFEC